MKHHHLLRLATLAMLFIVPAVQAHPQATSAGGLVSGLSHPFLGLDHLLAMVAVGLWAVQLGGSALWKVPLAFVFTMVIGSLISFTSISLPMMEPMIIASVMILGLIIAFKAQAAPVIASLLVAVFAVFHGYAHGVELPLTSSPLAYVIGFAIASMALHGVGMAVGLAGQQTRMLLRGGGVAIAGVGLMMFII